MSVISINTDSIRFLYGKHGPSENPEPKFSISDDIDEDGYRTVNFSFKVGAGDKWTLSVSKGTGDFKESYGFGQGSVHPEKPENVVTKANEWLEEEKEKKDKYKANIHRFAEAQQ